MGWWAGGQGFEGLGPRLPSQRLGERERSPRPGAPLDPWNLLGQASVLQQIKLLMHGAFPN